MARAAEQLPLRSDRGSLGRTSRDPRRVGRPDGRTPIAQGSRPGCRRDRRCGGGPFLLDPGSGRAPAPSRVGARALGPDGSLVDGRAGRQRHSRPCVQRALWVRAVADLLGDRRGASSGRDAWRSSHAPCRGGRMRGGCRWAALAGRAQDRHRESRPSCAGAGSAGCTSAWCARRPAVCSRRSHMDLPLAVVAPGKGCLSACGCSALDRGPARCVHADNLLRSM